MNGYGRGVNQDNHNTSIITRETVGMTLLIFSVILLIIATIGQYIFGEIGVAIASVLTGIAGMLVYPLLVLAVYASVSLVAGRSFLPVRWMLRVGAVLLSTFLIVHLATSGQYIGNGYGAYLSGCWNQEAGVTGGGVLYGVIVYPLQAVLSSVGAYILFALLVAVSLFFVVRATPLKALFAGDRKAPKKTEQKRQEPPVQQEKRGGERVEPIHVTHSEPIRRKRPEPTPRVGQTANVPRGYTTPYQGQTPTVVYDPSQAGSRLDYGSLSDHESSYATGDRDPRRQQVGYYGKNGTFEQSFLNPPGTVVPNGERSGRVGYYGSRSVDQNGLFGSDRQSGRANETSYTPDTRSERDILFSSDASNYHRNLIYSNDSYFNTRQRRSSIQPQEPTIQTTQSNPTVTPSATPIEEKPFERPYRDEPRAPESYTQRYGEQAETPRPVMPRKIVEQRPDNRTPFRADLNYPDLPRSRFDEPKEELPRSRFDEPKEELPRSRFDEPKEELPRSRFDEPKEELPRSRFDEPKEELPRSRFDEPKEELPRSRFDEPKEELPRSRFDEPKEELPRARFDEPKEELPRARFDEPKATETDFAPQEDPRENEQEYRNVFSRGGDRPDRIQLKPVTYDYFTETMNRKMAERQQQENRSGEQEPKMGDGQESPKSESTSEPVRFSTEGRIGFGEWKEEEEPSRAEEILGKSQSKADLFDDDPTEELAQPTAQEPNEQKNVERQVASPAVGSEARDFADSQPRAPKRRPHKRYRRPPLDIFQTYDNEVGVTDAEIQENSEIIIDTLAGFRVDAKIVKVTVGPSVTRYDIDIPRNISVRSVIKHEEEIALRLRTGDGVNMYSNSEIGAISIEVPNSKRAKVGIGSLLTAPDYCDKDPDKLMFVIGKDIEGRAVCRDIVSMTHLLVAGSSGSGKSVCLNTMLVSLVCKYSPDQLRLILIDPKKIEFQPYEGLPHLMINEIITDPQKAIMALNWAIKEMERRYTLFQEMTRGGRAVRNISEYNNRLEEDEEKLPKIVVVVDELADLMAVSKKEIEEKIQRLTQKARAAGIHLVIATQRPSVDVITGVIKGNLPTRMAFRVIQEVDSRTILDESGAEKLLGYGDMLFKSSGMFGCLRVQGALVKSSEVDEIVGNIKANNEAYFDPEVSDFINRETADSASSSGDDDSVSVGEEYLKALALVVNLGQASISLLQRKCGIGYNHAGKIIDWMEMMGYVSPFDGAKARNVLLTKEEFESKYGSQD